MRGAVPNDTVGAALGPKRGRGSHARPGCRDRSVKKKSTHSMEFSCALGPATILRPEDERPGSDVVEARLRDTPPGNGQGRRNCIIHMITADSGIAATPVRLELRTVANVRQAVTARHYLVSVRVS